MDNRQVNIVVFEGLEAGESEEWFEDLFRKHGDKIRKNAAKHIMKTILHEKIQDVASFVFEVLEDRNVVTIKEIEERLDSYLERVQTERAWREYHSEK